MQHYRKRGAPTRWGPPKAVEKILEIFDCGAPMNVRHQAEALTRKKLLKFL